MSEKAESWDHLLHLLYTDEYREEKLFTDIGRYRSLYVYRGLNRDWPLETTLMRIKGDYPSLESHLLRNFYKYGRKLTVPSRSFWDWFSIAQHYGLPTRLLDWTTSPLVALHFATVNTKHYKESGYIWAVHRNIVHDFLPVNLLDLLKNEDVVNFTVEMLSSVFNSNATFNPRNILKEFDSSKGKGPAEKFLLFFEPPSIDDRIVNQFAIFSIINDPKTRVDKWLQNIETGSYRKIEIPAKLKLQIRDRLDMSNITERVLFPGLEGLSSWLKRHYSNLKENGKR